MPLPGTFHNYFYAAFRDTFCNSFCTTFPATFSNLPRIYLIAVPIIQRLSRYQIPRLTSVTAKWKTPEPSEAALGRTFWGSLPSPRLRHRRHFTAGSPVSPLASAPAPAAEASQANAPVTSPLPTLLPCSPALTCRSEGRGAPRGQARVPMVSGEDRAARGRPTEDPRLGRARRGLSAGERWQPAAVLLSAAARGTGSPLSTAAAAAGASLRLARGTARR